MKKLFNFRTILYVLLSIVVFGCNNSAEKHKSKSGRIIYDEYGWNTTIRVFVVDECEYIAFDTGGSGGVSIIHKQNCRFCEGRKKKLF